MRCYMLYAAPPCHPYYIIHNNKLLHYIFALLSPKKPQKHFMRKKIYKANTSQMVDCMLIPLTTSITVYSSITHTRYANQNTSCTRGYSFPLHLCSYSLHGFFDILLFLLRQDMELIFPFHI